MKPSVKILTNLLLLVTNTNLAASLAVEDLSSHTRCRTVPSSEAWPCLDEWKSLNKSLNGHLLAPNPPAIVCDTSRKGTFDKAACAAVGKSWTDPMFHASDPVSVQFPNWQDDACLPTAVYNKSTACYLKSFPHYVVDASKAEHVAEALKFANQKGVRLSVKGTGHDFLGRSSGRGLSIWTHNIRGINIFKSFKPQSCNHCDGTAAVRVFAGEVFEDVYKVGKKHGLIPVVGADGTVGLGGYLLGGGHSPISTKFGLAVDRVLEMKAVTPTGEIVTANSHQNQELFWALRGGGGSTFGVLISATLKAFPTFPICDYSIEFSSTKKEAKENNNDNFYSALADFHALVPLMTESNLTGYNFFGPAALISGKPLGNLSALEHGPQAFFQSGFSLDKTESDTRKALQPLWKKLNATKGIVSIVKVHSQQDVYTSVGVSTGSSSSGTSYGSAGVNLAMSSRLLGKKALSNKKDLISALRAMQPTAISGLMISGPGVINAPNPQDVSVTPAWRRTYYHITTGAQWAYRNTTSEANGLKLNNAQSKILLDLAPEMGCYMNEANGEEPDFQQAFWGTNYKKLLELKHKYDPNGVFYCNACVGSEEWEVKESGELCRKAGNTEL